MNLFKGIVRAGASRILVRGDPVRIVSGPLRGWQIPRRIAESHLAMLCGRYDRVLEREIVAQVGSGDVAYDIGANIGYVSLLLASLVGPSGTVHAFEPSPNEGNDAEALIACNTVQDRVQVHRVAVCNADGEASFQAAGSTSILATLPTAMRSQQLAASTYTVPTVRIDSFVTEQGNALPNFMKIDVESAEALVLEGARETLRKARPRLIVELHGRTAAEKTLSILLAEQYRCFHLTRRGKTMITASGQLYDVFTPRIGTTQVLAVP